MSCSPEMTGKGKVSGKAPERPSFAQTCSLLSRLLKEKERSSPGDFGFGMSGINEDKAERETKNLLSSMDPEYMYMLEPNDDGASKVSQSDFLMKFADFGAFSGSKEIDTDVNTAENFRSMKGFISTSNGFAPMTIFYAGKVVVFNDIPADKVGAIFNLAADDDAVAKTRKKPEKSTIMNADPAAMGGGILMHARPDLPLATKASLHRFFAKRKDRASSRAPYRVNPEPSGNPMFDGNINPARPGSEVNESSIVQLELRL